MRYQVSMLCLFLVAGAACSTDSEALQTCSPGARFCNQGWVWECNDDGLGSSLLQPCEFGCAAGQCVQWPADALAENLEPLPGDVQESVCKPSELFCEDGALFECSVDGTQTQLIEECEFGCENSQCLAGPGADVPPGDIKPEPEIVDPEPDIIDPPEIGCDECQQGDLYCSGIKNIFYCTFDGSGCWVWGPAQICEDGNPCTDDACAVDKGCITAPAIGPCEDGDPCTAGDQCVNGSCIPGQNTCQCQFNADCVPLDDGNFCNGLMVCVAGMCQPDPTTVVDCPPLPSMCSESLCNPANGQCDAQPLPNGTPCPSPPDPCVVDATCQSGECVANPMDCSYLDDLCVEGACNQGQCIEEPVPGNCDDGNPATCDDACENGVCMGHGCVIEGGETCADAIDLGGGGSFEVNLCDYQKDYAYGFCDLNGPDLFFKVKATFLNGHIDMDTSGSFPAMTVAPRLWNESHCETMTSFGCGSGLQWSGSLGLTNHLWWVVSSSDGSCGPVKISASPVSN